MLPNCILQIYYRTILTPVSAIFQAGPTKENGKDVVIINMYHYRIACGTSLKNSQILNIGATR